jgi:protein SCO1/2
VNKQGTQSAGECLVSPHANMYSSKLRTLLLSGLLFCLMGSYLIWQTVHARSQAIPSQPPSLPIATLVNDEQPVPKFSLQRVGGTVTDADLIGHWTLLFFGYTRCPQVCPTELALLRDVKARLSQINAAAPQVIFVSIDHRRDSVELLRSFVHEFDADFIGATGLDDSLAALTKHLGVFYQRNDQRDASNYTVDHSTAIYLVDPRGRLKAVFGPPQQAGEMARELVAMTGE